MSWLVQPDGSRLEIFGSGGAEDVAARLTTLSGGQVPVLGQIPLSIPLREGSDAGNPIVLSDPADPAATAIGEIALKISQDKIGLAGKKLRVSL
jgi:ATP-binding protein involved in chromosome partitioning